MSELIPIYGELVPFQDDVFTAMKAMIKACGYTLHSEEADGFSFRFWLTDQHRKKVWETHSCQHLTSYWNALGEALRLYHEKVLARKAKREEKILKRLEEERSRRR